MRILVEIRRKKSDDESQSLTFKSSPDVCFFSTYQSKLEVRILISPAIPKTI